MKKILLIPLLILMLFMFNVKTSAASNMTNAKAENNETITLQIILSESKVVNSGAISFEYDETLFTLVSGEWKVSNPLLSNFDMEKELGAFIYKKATPINGTIFEVTFKISSKTLFGDFPVVAKLQFEEENKTRTSEDILGYITIYCNHSFTEKDPTSQNIASEATCKHPAMYYYVCSKCGMIGEQTYEEGSPLNHNYDKINYDEEYHWKECECGEISEKEKHEIENEIVSSEGFKIGKCRICSQSIKTPIESNRYSFLRNILMYLVITMFAIVFITVTVVIIVVIINKNKKKRKY